MGTQIRDFPVKKEVPEAHLEKRIRQFYIIYSTLLYICFNSLRLTCQYEINEKVF